VTGDAAATDAALMNIKTELAPAPDPVGTARGATSGNARRSGSFSSMAALPAAQGCSIYYFTRSRSYTVFSVDQVRGIAWLSGATECLPRR
jgi:hypothetical protein